MIIAVSIIVGFKREVRNTVAGFGAHLRISGMEAVNAYENSPVVADDSLRTLVSRYAEVKHVQRYSMKPGMVKTDDAFQGIMLKGVGQEYDLSFLKAHLLEGEMPQFSDSASSGRVLVSRSLADKLKLRPGDKIDTYYIEEEIRARRLQVAGIYQTNFAEYDNLFILSDLYLVNRLNRWKPGQASGLEVELRDYAGWRMPRGAGFPLGRLYGRLRRGVWRAQRRAAESPTVCLAGHTGCQHLGHPGADGGRGGFTMISGLLIIIIERTSMIGILKALGRATRLSGGYSCGFSVFLIGRGCCGAMSSGWASFSSSGLPAVRPRPRDVLHGHRPRFPELMDFLCAQCRHAAYFGVHAVGAVLPDCPHPSGGGVAVRVILALLTVFSHTEFTSAVQLVVEGVFLEQLVAPFLQAAFAPVLFPEDGAGAGCGGAPSGFVDLVEVFPARGGKGGGEHPEPVQGGVAGGGGEAQGEARQAAASAFGFALQPLYVVQPGGVVVVGVHEVQPLCRDEADGLLLADVILLPR